METLQNILNLIVNFYNQNALSFWIYVAIIVNLLFAIFVFKNFKLKKQIKEKSKKISYLEKFQTINICEIKKLNDIISTYNSKFVDIESDNLPKRNIKTGRFEKRL
jgi:Ca2+/Na+ antiporter